ncbi:hypothetical protein NitYY0814_C0346 [Nitratiruptor sp. YY08-14]|nr:hypothetical protein NitYY0810_C0346 [Nitratiruptor sp. YY08-10]BCD63519.1 hypothetical protein NitYY0814_C0346 [Nitratiruptor sp. YY08-14]BCD83071.1 hypothetical protein NrS2_21 [Nitratiruptor phage NrS-2]BCD83137.1 hypothetical protein NrS3_21 [Nitratiruptor phage NrS-3]
MKNNEIITKVCKELGIDKDKIDKSPTLNKILQEYQEYKTFEKVLQRITGVDRILNNINRQFV